MKATYYTELFTMLEDTQVLDALLNEVIFYLDTPKEPSKIVKGSYYSITP